MNINVGLKVQLASCLTMGLLLCFIFSAKLLSRNHDSYLSHASNIDDNILFHDPRATVAKPVRVLLEAIKATSRKANGGKEVPDLTDEERAEWELAYPCRSRVELKLVYARRKHVKDMAENRLWEMVLQEYAKLHRLCMQKVGNLKQSFMEKNSSTGCKFLISDIDWSIPAGLSNRILSITSAVLYAVITQRVILIPKSNLVTSLMCEPFPGSSWDMNGYGEFSWYPWAEEAKHIWSFHKDVYRELDERMVTDTANFLRSPRSSAFAASMQLGQFHPDNRFFCDAEQVSFTSVTWLYFTGCIYTIPKFFAIPSFRPTLEALFPGRFVLTQMLRSIMLPVDPIWDKVVQSDATYFENADRRVGVQVRYYYGKSHYEEMNDIFNERILACAMDNDIFPARSIRKLLGVTESVQVLVASLYTGFYDHMTKVYLTNPPASGENVRVVQLSNNMVQQFGWAVDTQSLVEIFILSFSDILLNTPISTFGGLAQAYGSLIPWKIETLKGEDLPPCERDTTVDLCYQTAEPRCSCRYNNVNGLRITDLSPYFQTCLKGFKQVGLQLVTDHNAAIPAV